MSQQTHAQIACVSVAAATTCTVNHKAPSIVRPPNAAAATAAASTGIAGPSAPAMDEAGTGAESLLSTGTIRCLLPR